MWCLDVWGWWVSLRMCDRWVGDLFTCAPHTLECWQARLKAKEAWRQRLVARSQQREYDRMVKNVHWG